MHFQETADAQKMYKGLVAKAKALSIDYIEVVNDEQNVVSVFISEKIQYAVQVVVIPVMAEFIIHNKEDNWILDYIENLFYFTDYEEKKQILEIAKGLMDGNNPDIPGVQDVMPREQLIVEALHDFMEIPISFSFESFLKFRMRSYNEALLQIIESAIDEYKLEQEYQTFIQGLREFREKREPKLEQLHILHDEQFYFYNHEFTEIKRDELFKYIDRKLILHQPLYIDSAVLAPLVSIAPKSISIYTDQIDNGMVQTIHNIFLENVTIYTKKSFENTRLKAKKI
ncbi:putative sporulation protein YtxC [Fredinandcohnia onubensis]|uniref:putative sporulation protein YtxC n=1 Tax=Fredinandcohnia onubensis TaxID=1571209 RepID=UPI00211F2897|nr:putative sporulation protein YtxC [Fredinandcohnia onubensis]